ncbi:MAG: GntR family transcriptional regulator [Desulfobacterales bacterium]
MLNGKINNGNGVLYARSLREQVYEYLRGEIQAGRLVPGSYIQLNKISARLGISKTPLRDAIIQMECEGFVTILPRRGVLVNRLDLETIKNHLEIVGALESSVIRTVFHRITNAHLAEMVALNQKMRDIIRETSFDTFDPQYYQYNIAFHNVFLNLSANTILKQMLMRIKQQLYDFPRPAYIREWETINCDEHDQFIAHIQQGDKDAAAKLWREHHWGFESHKKYIVEFYAQGNQEIQNQLDRMA